MSQVSEASTHATPSEIASKFETLLNSAKSTVETYSKEIRAISAERTQWKARYEVAVEQMNAVVLMLREAAPRSIRNKVERLFSVCRGSSSKAALRIGTTERRLNALRIEYARLSKEHRSALDAMLLDAAKIKATVKKVIQENNSLREGKNLDLRFETEDYDALCNASLMPTCADTTRLRAELDISKTEIANLRSDIDGLRRMFGVLDADDDSNNDTNAADKINGRAGPSAAVQPVQKPSSNVDCATEAMIIERADAAVSPIAIPPPAPCDPFSAPELDGHESGVRPVSAIPWLQDLSQIDSPSFPFDVISPSHVEPEQTAVPPPPPVGPVMPTRIPPAAAHNVVRPAISYAQTLNTPPCPYQQPVAPASTVPLGSAAGAFVPMASFPMNRIPEKRLPPPFSVERRRLCRAQQRRRAALAAATANSGGGGGGQEGKKKRRAHHYACVGPRRKHRRAFSTSESTQFFTEVASDPQDSRSMAATPSAP